MTPDHALLDGRYRLVEQIGRGGTATLWRGYDERLNRTVAVKLFNPAAVDATQVYAEAERLAQLSHPHVATVFDAGRTHGQPYLVMEFVRGRPLSELLAGGGLPWPAAVACLAQVTSALTAAHARGLVHRDVSPANVMVTTAGAKLVDFGLSAVAGEPEVDPDGALWGTPAYVAPERLRSGTVTPTADVYSAGLVLYRALSGHMPWPITDAEDRWSIREAIAPAPLPPHVPEEVGRACLRCLSPDPDDRPDAAELAAVLRVAMPRGGPAELARLAASAAEPTHLLARPRSGSVPPTGRSRSWLAIAAAVLVVAVAGWSAITWASSTAGIPGMVAEAAAPPAAPACAVTFTLAADDGQRFHAAITTAPADSLPAGWRLSLRLPPSPVRIDPGGGWDRRADVVTSAPQPAVAAGASATLTLAGSHDGAIALPTKIDVSGHPCDVVLLDASARPAPPVVTELALPAPVVAAAKAPKAPAPKAPKPAADKHKPGPAKDKR